MAESTNRVHVSPGIYMSETVDMKSAANSLGITKLAVVGETLKGPAFQPYWVSTPKEFANVFGGTSTKKFIGSNYPQYELPYIANAYLSQSNQLCVVRTLGFSGYNAGPAWLITGEKSTIENGNKYVIAVLRSRGSFKYRPEYARFSDGACACQNAYDSLTYNVGELSSVASCNAPKSYNMDAVMLKPYYSLNAEGSECTSYSLSGSATTFTASNGDLGRFTIKCIVGSSKQGITPDDEEVKDNVVSIPVSLNPSDKDYILKVLGTTNDDGDQPLYVESLYDVAWQELVTTEGYDIISEKPATYNVGYAVDYCGLDSVTGILNKHEGELTKKDYGKRYLYTTKLTNGSPEKVRYYIFDYYTNAPKIMDPQPGATVSFDEAKTCATHIEVYELFKITGDTQYAGTWVNAGVESAAISELITAPQFGGTSDRYTVKKATDFDLFACGLCEECHIYTVSQITDGSGVRHYVYKAYDKEQTGKITGEDKIKAEDRLLSHFETTEVNRKGSLVYNYEDGLYYKNVGGPDAPIETGQIDSPTYEVTPLFDGNLYVDGVSTTDWQLEQKSSSASPVIRNNDGSWPVERTHTYYFKNHTTATGPINYSIYTNEGNKTVIKNTTAPISCDLNNYKSAFRYSSTPWVVSNAKGDTTHIEVNRLFRFHTISDGTSSVDEVKVSIENIRPDLGQFDVVVRSYYDTDSSPLILERFSKCTMKSGKKFIGYMIGTLDGQYESKSKYITVEIANTSAAKNSIPAGFLGYSFPLYEGESVAGNTNTNVKMCPIKYNTKYDEGKLKKKQYFGLSDITGYDYDYFTFKGNMATLEDPLFTSHGFHLDCRLDEVSYGADRPTITVDGQEGYKFDTVSVNARTASQSNTPIISTENDMGGSIYEDVKLRKFTLVFAQGFDGWDPYRDRRSNTDEFAFSTYKGLVNKSDGVGYAFDTFNTGNESNSYNIEGAAITSDYYSTLAGISLLKNPEEVDINLLATPGIDLINNSKLISEVFNILEDRADTFYIVTLPDKELGASDYDDDISDVDEAVFNLENTELHSGYAATYYPWIKIEDSGEYIFIPPTRDIVRNMAESDNSNTTMNLAPAGLTRGRVKAIRARKNLKIAECDTLYEANINPVRTYAQEGVVVMGQKTLRESDDLLNRIDVRRCVLRMRKLIAIGTLGLIFEPNDPTTVKSFKSIVNGIMDGFIKNRAISHWKMEVDESEEARDRLEIPATIYIKPVRALEYISVNFVVTNNGAYFED